METESETKIEWLRLYLRSSAKLPTDCVKGFEWPERELLFERGLASTLLPGGGSEIRMVGQQKTQITSSSCFRYSVLPPNSRFDHPGLDPEDYLRWTSAVESNPDLRLAKVYLWEAEITLQEGRRDYVDVAILYFAKAAEVLGGMATMGGPDQHFKVKLTALNTHIGGVYSADQITEMVRARNSVAHARANTMPADSFVSVFDFRNLVRKSLLRLGLP